MYKRLAVILYLLLTSGTVSAQSKINQFDAEGKRHGVWKKMHRNGNIRYQGKFEHGKEVGTFKFYAITGEKHPMVIKKFQGYSGIVDVHFFSKKGIVESQGKMEGKKRVGIWTYFFNDGKTVLSTETYKDGLLDGEVKIFYKSGKITEISHYKSGKLHGNRIRYSDTGVVNENLTYKNGIMNGPAVIYDEKGEIFARGSYENGVRTGVWEFNMDGEMVKSAPDKIRKK
jgi:antitoxin component YwqK of YwqJK toxin-antitoxin module